ncbi:MAG TPA: hypothetical protein VLG50_00015, partial [Candidatus Saccharimonadales bacterium]|nr:hypothetical protein [Candidatus Saccharimonadales bacterium]
KRLTEAIDFLKKSGFKLKQHQVKQNDELEYAILEKETKEYPDFTKIIISAESDSCFNVSLEQRIFKKTGKDSELYATSYANSQKWHQVEESWNRSNHLLDVLEKITKNK